MKHLFRYYSTQHWRQWLAMAVLVLSVLAGSNSTPAIAQGSGYVWKTVQISGAGAMVDGVYASPLQQGLFYIRTDVGGAYKYDSVNGKWIQMMDFLTREQAYFYCCESLGLDPNNANVLYFAGGFTTTSGNGAIFKSTNQGTTWTQLPLSVPMGGNMDRRWAGERLAVSPSNSNVVLFGTRTVGLQRSTDGGTTWASVPTIPIPADTYGVECVAFDKNTSGLVYVAVNGNGVYKSTDNGATFTSIGGNTNPRRMKVGPDSTLWYTNGSGVSKYAGGAWTNYTVGGADVYVALGIDSTNASDILVEKGEWSNRQIWRTLDGGTTWTQETFSVGSQVPWAAGVGLGNYWAQDFAFDPFNASSVWGNRWHTDNINAASVYWLEIENGHEEDVTECVTSPPSGAELFMGVADDDGFRDLSTGLDSWPTTKLGIVGSWGESHTWSIDAEESNPNNLVRIASQAFYGVPTVSKSTDNGVTWNGMTGMSNLTTIYPMRVAYSATNANNIVVICNGNVSSDTSGNNWVPVAAVNPWRYTTDGGTTWLVCSGLPTPPAPWGLWYHQLYLAADKVNGSKFYYHDLTTGKVYRSSDGGATWIWMNTGTGQLIPSAGKQWNQLRTRPGVEGDLWICVDNDPDGPPTTNRTSDEGLYHSTDGGATWAKISTLTRAWMFAIGAPQNVGGTPALYAFGRMSGDTADKIYRSLDLGATWLNIMDPAVNCGDNPLDMDASRQTFGRVFVGTGGRGYFYGSPPTLPGAPTGLAANPGNAQIALSWNTSTGATSYNLKRSTTTGGPYTTLASPTTTSYTNTGLTNGTTYYYVVSAVNTVGESPNSGQVASTPQLPATIVFAATAPVIDGNNTDAVWSAATSYNLTHPSGTLPTGQTLSASYKAAWDSTNLYLLVDIADSTLLKYVTYPWEGDSVELYVDSTNSKTTTYGATDFQYEFPWNSTVITETQHSPASLTGVAFAQVNVTGGYRIEAKIPWTTLGVTPAANNLVGIDVHINNADTTAGTRDGKLMWWDSIDMDWSKPSLFGTGQLQSGSSAPPAPTGLTATPGNAQVALAWNASTGATSYSIYRGTAAGGESATAIVTGVATTAYTNTGLANGTHYYYTAKAVNASGTSPASNEANAIPVAPPAAPTGLTATAGNTQVVLSWTASSGATTYNVLRSTVSGSGYASVATGIAVTNYTNTGLINGTTYYFVVTATNAGGTSANSAQASATPVASSGSLSGSVAASPSTANLTTLGTTDWGHWGLGGAPAWDHKASGGTQISNYTIVGAGTPATNSGMVTTYSWTDGTPTASNAGNTTGVTINGLNNGFSITAPADTTQRTLKVYVGGYLGAGTLTAHLSDGSASDYVDASQSNPTNGYNAAYTLTYKAGAARKTLTVTWKTTTDSSGNGSCNVSIQAAYLVSAPPAPTGLTATPGNAQIALSWTASSGAASYSVYRGTTAGGESGTAIATGIATTAYTNTGLTNGTHYYYTVKAVNAGGTSAASNEASATPTTANLTGSVAAPPASINLTTEGVTDWGQWGESNNHYYKTSGGSKISDVTYVAGAQGWWWDTTEAITFSWTDGSPTTSKTTAGIKNYSGLNAGFSITAPADTTQRTLKFYCKGSGNIGKLTAHLSDGSAVDYVDTSQSSHTGTYYAVYTLSYKAASAGQTLTVTWISSTDYSGNNSCYVGIQAASLF